MFITALAPNTLAIAIMQETAGVRVSWLDWAIGFAPVGIVLLAAYFLGGIQGTLGIVALVAGVVMLGTAAMGWCPPYTLLGINTCGVKQNSKAPV